MLSVWIIFLYIVFDLGGRHWNLGQEGPTWSRSFGGIFKRRLIFLVFSLIYLIFVAYKHVLKAGLEILLIWLAFVIIDLIKYVLIKAFKNKKSPQAFALGLFVGDLFLRLVTVFIFKRIYESGFDPSFVTQWIDHLFYGDYHNGYLWTVPFDRAVAVILIAFSGAQFVPLALDFIYGNVGGYKAVIEKLPSNDPWDNTVKAGKWIGILERALILILYYMDSLASIGFVIAAKSLVRFKLMDNKMFSEYYLLGTLLSVVYTLVMNQVLLYLI